MKALRHNRYALIAAKIAQFRFNSEENRAELARACGKYLLATRMTTVSEVKKKVLSKRGKYKVIKDNLHAREVIVGAGERRRRYKRYLRIEKGSGLELDRKAIKEAGRYDGKWVIETNDDTISFEDAACGYKGLMVIEQCFRSLKRTQIKMTPMFHWLPHRIETHVRICVLALLIERVAELSCQMPWSSIRNILQQLRVTECQTMDHVFFRLNEVSKEVFNKAFTTKRLFTSPKPKLEIYVCEGARGDW